MNTLSDVLKRFNRKERNLLVRAVLGDEQRPLTLSDKFVEDVEKQLEIEIKEKENAWWATDYHISWLAGALACYSEENAWLEKKGRANRSSGSSRLIEGNQEDVDLVIASGSYLILIEAKAYGSWDIEQLRSKLERINLLHVEYEEIADKAKLADRDRVRMHFLLTCPPELKDPNVECPAWISKQNRIPRIELHLPKSEPILQVNRCDADGNKTAKGDYWRIVEY